MTWHRALPLLLIVLGVGLLASASEPLSNVSDHPAPEGTPMADVPEILSRERTRIRRLLPYALTLLGLWLLAGCFYLPLPEQQVAPKQKDFRPLLGEINSNRPIRPGVTRAQVTALLGPASQQYSDGSLIYALATKRAVWVYPLCFQAAPAWERGYALRLQFDEHDTLSRWELADADERRDFPWPGVPFQVRGKAMNNLNSKDVKASTTQPAVVH